MRSKNKPPKQNTMRNQEKEGMKEEREKKSTKRKKRTLLKFSFCREVLFIFYFGWPTIFLKKPKSRYGYQCCPVPVFGQFHFWGRIVDTWTIGCKF